MISTLANIIYTCNSICLAAAICVTHSHGLKVRRELEKQCNEFVV
jgi:hypothetical protein